MKRSQSIQVHGNSGFTMIDVVITVLIIGILAAIATPRFAESLHRIQAESAASRIQADLGLARENAVSTGGSQTVSFNTLTESYTLPGISNLNHPDQTYSVDLSSAPYNANLISAVLGPDSDLQFDQYGQPDSGGTITISSGSFQTTVTVDSDTGRATIP